MKLSIVATLYHSAPYIAEFHRRASEVARAHAGDDFEIVYVNDGSPDNSLDVVVKIAASDAHTVVVDLSRNFGHHKAMMTGLAHSRGERVFLIDSDLEEEPEWLNSFAAQMSQESADVVYGIQLQRRGNWFDRASGRFFYRLFRALTSVDQPSDIVTARLLSRRYVDALVSHREREVNIGGLWIITGFRQISVEVVKHSTSPTTYSLSRKLEHFINAVTSFSSLPLVFTFYAGLCISSTAMIYILYLAVQYVFSSHPLSGYTSIAASIWLFSGLIILFLGIQGIYISKIFSEVKQRPYTIIRHIYRFATPANSDQ